MAVALHICTIWEQLLYALLVMLRTIHVGWSWQLQSQFFEANCHAVGAGVAGVAGGCGVGAGVGAGVGQRPQLFLQYRSVTPWKYCVELHHAFMTSQLGTTLLVRAAMTDGALSWHTYGGDGATTAGQTLHVIGHSNLAVMDMLQAEAYCEQLFATPPLCACTRTGELSAQLWQPQVAFRVPQVSGQRVRMVLATVVSLEPHIAAAAEQLATLSVPFVALVTTLLDESRQLQQAPTASIGGGGEGTIHLPHEVGQYVLA